MTYDACLFIVKSKLKPMKKRHINKIQRKQKKTIKFANILVYCVCVLFVTYFYWKSFRKYTV